MIGSRITHATVAQNALAYMQNNYARAGKLSDQLSSGQRIQVPSDDPSGTVQSLALRADARAQTQYARSADDGLGWLTVADSALQSASSTMTELKQTVLQGANAGAMSPEARVALADKVKAARDHLLSLANSTFLDRPVFGGSTVNATAYATTADATGAYAYTGDTGAVNRRLDDTTTVRVDTSAADTFEVAGKTVFQALDEIADHLINNPGALSADLSTVAAFHNQLLGSAAKVGVNYNRVDAMKTAATDQALKLNGDVSSIEEVDIAATMVQMQMANMAYQASLGATSKVIQPTLLDFLK